MNEIRLIVNADDFARSPGVNQGIRKAHRAGIVSTTTAMMNLEAADHQVADMHTSCPELGIGVHLNITYGKPLSSAQDIPSLVNEEGNFRDFHELLDSPEEINPYEAEREWRTQIDRFLDCGVVLDHLDSHHHSAVFTEGLFEMFLDLAAECECGVRNPNPLDHRAAEIGSLYPKTIIQFVEEKSAEMMLTKDIHHPDALLASFFADRATSEHLLMLLEELPPGTYELMCHPGIADAGLMENSSYASYREKELEVLTSQEIAVAIRSNAIKLHTFQTAWQE
ncbi:MAG: ChbG/HpnK family deacetylase [Anaerolineales bacterium]|jgi:predicted glycoside hydrolase/deacetylase ChbG (UPF0249 family)